MHTLLIVITVLSAVVAAGLAVVLARLLREDRQRSNARVAALALLAAEPADAPEVERTPTTQPWRPGAAEAHTMWSGTEEPADDIALREANGDAAPGLFSEREPASPWGRRFAVVGTLSAVLAAVLLAATFGGRHNEPAPAASQSAVAHPAPPLELLELRHVRDAQGLTIMGVIRNPAGTTPMSHLVATAFVFGPDGTFLTSSRAPLADPTLAAGAESPFVVPIPVNGEVSRYRIGFRTEDGQVVAHVDKRTTGTFASKREQP